MVLGGRGGREETEEKLYMKRRRGHTVKNLEIEDN